MTQRTEDAQTTALRAFLLLCALAPAWQGRLVLRAGLDEQGAALSRAAVIAGAACLAVDWRPEVCRAALRAGACDFVVNTVDEALRILKNEIRLRRPVSVALATGEAEALAELAARGVAPDLLSHPPVDPDDPGISAFADLGVRIVAGSDSTRIVDDYVRNRHLTFHEFHFASAQELSDLDRRLTAATADAGLRSRWAAAAPGVFYRERPFCRVAFLTPAEGKLS